jgi:glycosyltransferase involved in cell wall biosynthesis
MQPNNPRVTVGMPVRHGAATLAQAIASWTAQTYADFQLILSDNASTDDTEQIGREAAAQDSRIRYIRQPTNLGLEGNFDFVLSQATTPYFTWAAADDVRSPDYLKLTVAFLDAHAEYAGATCPARFDTGTFDALWMGDASREENSRFERVLQFFGPLHANARMYALWRTAALSDLRFSSYPYLAGDWALVTTLLSRGKFKCLEEGAVILGSRGLSSDKNIFNLYRRHRRDWVFPLYEVTRHSRRLFAGASLKQHARLYRRLWRLNRVECVLQWKYRHGADT